MADATDFLPEAGLPLAEKSQYESICGLSMEDLRNEPGAYVVLGSSGTYMYKGSARDLQKRITDHMNGRVARTRNRRPLKLVYFEYAPDYTEARKRENWLKSGQGRKWLDENCAWVAACPPLAENGRRNGLPAGGRSAFGRKITIWKQL